MIFRGAELEYDNFELLRGQSHAIKVTQRSKTAGKITISCSTTLCTAYPSKDSIKIIIAAVSMHTSALPCLSDGSRCAIRPRQIAAFR